MLWAGEEAGGVGWIALGVYTDGMCGTITNGTPGVPETVGLVIGYTVFGEYGLLQ